MSTRAKYYRVKPQEQKQENKPETDIIMKFSPTYGRYVGRGLTLFFGEDKQFVTIKAAERLIEKALWVAEVLRRKVADLHQVITITEKKIIDVYMPREEGLLKVEQERFLTIVEVTLTRKPTAEQLKAVGYQAPLTNVEGEFLTKESWAQGEKERAQRRETRGPREERAPREDRPPRENRGPREDRGPREERPRGEFRQDRRERTDNRGEERRRGGR